MKLGEKYKIEGTPTILFVDANGRIIGEFLGFRYPKEFLEESTKILNSAKSK